VIPARATAKISMRLVPEQDPHQVYQSFKQFVEAATPPGITFNVTPINIDPPVLAPPDGHGVRALARALERGYGRKPAFIRMGGSVPVTTAFQEALGVELLVTGFGLPDARLHSPNENFAISQFEGGIKTVIALLEEYAKP
jgi:acetylornithine deacetylase/succinyl-diaminopimelate desuccinylase-like protein